MKRGILSFLCVVLICFSAACQGTPGQLSLEGLRDENGDYLPMPGVVWEISVSEWEGYLKQSLGEPLDIGGSASERRKDLYRAEGQTFNGVRSGAEYEFQDGKLQCVTYQFPVDGDELFDSFLKQLSELYGEPDDSFDLEYYRTGFGHNWRREHDSYLTSMQVSKGTEILNLAQQIHYEAENMKAREYVVFSICTFNK